MLIAALQRLPAAQRLNLVLHYIARLSEDVVVQWFGGTMDEVDGHLDAGSTR